MTPTVEPGVLTGCHVLDLSTDPAAAIATWFLAEAGAEVIHVELPGTETPDQAAYATWNRSKRSVALDPADPDDAALLDRLVSEADVVVRDATSPAVTAHPKLVLCEVTWYPTGHPDEARTGDELLVQARSGVMDEVPNPRNRPTFIRFPISTWGAALLAATGIVAKLFQRERTGVGGVVRTSHLQGALYFLSNLWTEADHVVAELQTKYGVLNRPHPWIFRCADDRWVQANVGFVDVPMVIEVLAEMGEEQPELTVDNIPEVSQFYGRMFAQRPSQEWLDAFHELDIDCERLLHVGELYRDEKVVSNGYTTDLAGHRYAAVPVQVTPPLSVRGPAPAPGADTAEVRAHGWGGASRFLGRSPAAPLPAGGKPLDGLRAIDLGMNISAPFCAKLLGDLGADVVKVERCDGGDRLRAVHVQFSGGNRNKRSLGLKLGQSATRPLLEGLVAEADVVVHNLRQDKADKLGIDYESLAAVRPDLVYAQWSGYGWIGPSAGWPARDPSVGAWSGWTLDGGSESDGPIWMRLLIGDTGAAAVGLFGVLLTLLKREVDGEGGRVRASLLGMASLYASETNLDLATDTLAPIVAANELVTGTSPERCIRETADGWVAIVAPGRLDDVAAALGAAGPDGIDTAVLGLKAADAVDLLDAAGIGAEVVRQQFEHGFLNDPANIAAGLVARFEHPQHGELRQPGQYWDMGGPHLWTERPSPVFGQHTRELLDELGCTPEQRAALLEAGLVAGADLAP